MTTARFPLLSLSLFSAFSYVIPTHSHAWPRIYVRRRHWSEREVRKANTHGSMEMKEEKRVPLKKN